MKSRLALLLKPSLRGSISRLEDPKSSSGIMGGDEHLRAQLDSATKADDLMRKVLDKPSYSSSSRRTRKKGGGQPEKTGNHSKEQGGGSRAYRDRSRSHERRARSERDRNQGEF